MVWSGLEGEERLWAEPGYNEVVSTWETQVLVVIQEADNLC